MKVAKEKAREQIRRSIKRKKRKKRKKMDSSDLDRSTQSESETEKTKSKPPKTLFGVSINDIEPRKKRKAEEMSNSKNSNKKKKASHVKSSVNIAKNIDGPILIDDSQEMIGEKEYHKKHKKEDKSKDGKRKENVKDKKDKKDKSEKSSKSRKKNKQESSSEDTKQMPSYSNQTIHALVDYDIEMKGIPKKKILKWMKKNYDVDIEKKAKSD